MIKRAAAYSMLLLFSTRVVMAATDEKTIGFLNQLDGRYDCLMRQGLKGFHCQAKSDAFETYKNQCLKKYGDGDKRVQALQKVGFTVLYTAKTKLAVEPILPLSTGDTDFDNEAEQVIEMVRGMLIELLEPWASMNLEPVFGDEDYRMSTFHVQPTAGGYVITNDGDQPVTEFLDEQLKLYDSEQGKTARIRSFKTDFKSGARGYLLAGGEMDLGKKGFMESFSVEYREVKGFSMPSKAIYRLWKVGSSKAGAKEFNFDFTNYQIDQDTLSPK